MFFFGGGLSGCWAVGLLGWWAVGLLGWWAVRVVRLLGCVVGLLGCCAMRDSSICFGFDHEFK